MLKKIARTILAILRWLFPDPKWAQDSRPDRRREKRLRDEIRRQWYGMVLLALLCAGCAPAPRRTIYVPDGRAVRLRATIEGAAVWVLNEEGRPQAGYMDLPEGWFCLPDPGVTDGSK